MYNNLIHTTLAFQITLVDSPLHALKSCIKRCEDDPKCQSFDFTPGQRISDRSTDQRDGNTVSSGHQSHVEPEYKESVCHMYHDRASPDGGDVLVRQMNTYHFNKVCFTCKFEFSLKIYLNQKCFIFDGLN